MNEIERIITHCTKQMDRWNVDNPIYKEHEATRRYLQEYRHLLQAQAERDKMRCENCNNCEQGETVYDRYCVELEKNCYTMKFCSEFKLKENTP